MKCPPVYDDDDDDDDDGDWDIYWLLTEWSDLALSLLVLLPLPL